MYPQLADDAPAPPAAPTPWPTLQPSARLLLPAPEPPVPFERLPYQQWREALDHLEHPMRLQGPAVAGWFVGRKQSAHKARQAAQQPAAVRTLLTKLSSVRLALAVLYTAALDLLAPKRPLDFRDARDWIFSEADEDEEQSFAWWCSVADVDPDGTRRMLAHAYMSGQVPVGYNLFTNTTRSGTRDAEAA